MKTLKDGTSRYAVIEEFRKHLKLQTHSKIVTIAESFIEEGRQEEG